MNSPCTCRRPDFWRPLLRGIAVAIGLAWSCAYCFAEYAYTQGRLTLDYDKIELAQRLFPFEHRFRMGPAELAADGPSDSLSVELILRTLRTDPYEPDLLTALFLHQQVRGDRIAAERTFRRLYEVAPHSDLVRNVLATKKMP